jgi:hypothetical protein
MRKKPVGTEVAQDMDHIPHKLGEKFTEFQNEL